MPKARKPAVTLLLPFQNFVLATRFAWPPWLVRFLMMLIIWAEDRSGESFTTESPARPQPLTRSVTESHIREQGKDLTLPMRLENPLSIWDKAKSLRNDRLFDTTAPFPLPDSVMVAQQTLNLFV